jgi:hypothetical protein
VTFQLDSVKCQSLFYATLKEIERRENEKYPEYRSDLQRKQRGLEKLQQRGSEKDRKSKGGGKRQGDDDDQGDDVRCCGRATPGLTGWDA